MNQNEQFERKPPLFYPSCIATKLYFAKNPRLRRERLVRAAVEFESRQRFSLFANAARRAFAFSHIPHQNSKLWDFLRSKL